MKLTEIQIKANELRVAAGRPPINFELIKKIRDRIHDIPGSFYQNYWYVNSVEAPCGTAACLAGEAIICAATDVKEGVAELRALTVDADYAVPAKAAELLGFSGNYSSQYELLETNLFRGGAMSWPMRFRSQFQDGEESEAAVAMLDHILATGEVRYEP